MKYRITYSSMMADLKNTEWMDRIPDKILETTSLMSMAELIESIKMHPILEDIGTEVVVSKEKDPYLGNHYYLFIFFSKEFNTCILHYGMITESRTNKSGEIYGYIFLNRKNKKIFLSINELDKLI